MAQSHDRIARVNEILKREIADIIEKRGVGGGDTLVSVTKVHASESLRNATVYVSVFGSKPPEEILRALKQAPPGYPAQCFQACDPEIYAGASFCPRYEP